MKKSLLIGSICMALSLHAEYTDQQRIQDMQTMENAMAQIQKGILYNAPTLVDDGVAKLQSVATKIEPPRKDDQALGVKNSYNARYAKQLGDRISSYAGEVKMAVHEGRKHKAARSYVKVLNQCISCHNRIRVGK